MQLLNAEAIRCWDKYTIEHEPIASIDLMESAATRCVEWLQANNFTTGSIHIFCGKGNNGGDGLAMARLLKQLDVKVAVYILEFGFAGTPDFQTNLQRLHTLPVDIIFIQDKSHFPSLPADAIIIDCLFGTGLNRPLEGLNNQTVLFLNQSGFPIVSIDIPSGLPADSAAPDSAIITATHTLSFQVTKRAFLVAENERYTGQVHLLDIGLHQEYLKDLDTGFYTIDKALARSIYRPRKKFSHKGNYGHALLLAGSKGKIGAAILAARACLRSGVGLLTCQVPACGLPVIQTAVPEAMGMADEHDEHIKQLPKDLAVYKSIGIGPGLGQHVHTVELLSDLVSRFHHPLVMDADALNIISRQKVLLKKIPPNSIITPHPKEFERLAGASKNDFEKIEKAMDMAREYKIVVVLKGHHTFIATPGVKGYFNTSGNAGMATGGTGDVLTGMLTGLLAQGYDPVEAAMLGVYLHGLAGDEALQSQSMESMIAGDIIKYLGKAFLHLQK